MDKSNTNKNHLPKFNYWYIISHMVIKFACEYNGVGFNGFQSQGALRTVQSTLEDALSKYFNQPIKIIGTSRTDAGVHAREQVCCFPLPAGFKPNEKELYKLCAAVNAFLPADISVREFSTREKFHAQFDAKSKAYIYRVYVSPQRSALRDEFYHQIYQMPDINLMKKAASLLIGTRDFKAFCSDQTDKTDFIRSIFQCTIHDVHLPSITEISIVIRGNGFLRNMIRIIVGTLLEVGMKKKSIQQFVSALDSRDRKQAGPTAPAKGLCLERVEHFEVNENRDKRKGNP